MKVISMRGVELDMGRYIAQNEEAVAVGNGKMNARGDIIGRGGRVIKSRSAISNEYHKSNPRAVRRVSLSNGIDSQLFAASAPTISPQDAWKQHVENVQAAHRDANSKAETTEVPVRSKRKIVDAE